jgi:DNA-binding PadR family transcriptional regulator
MVTVEELAARSREIQLGLTLSDMVDKGLLDMEWSEEHGEVTYSLTPGGKDWAQEYG